MGTKKKKYRLYALVYGTKYIGTFELGPDDDVSEIAAQKGDTYISLCHQCSGEVFDGLEVDLDEIEKEEVETDEKSASS